MPFLKASRTIFLGFALFNCGKQAGITEYATDPVAMEKKLTMALLGGRPGGGNSPPKLLKVSDMDHVRIDKVAFRIIVAAREFVDEKIKR